MEAVPTSPNVDSPGTPKLALSVQRRSSKKSPDSEADPRDALAHIIDYLSTLRAKMEEPGQTLPSPPTPAQTALQARRLSRRGVVNQGLVVPDGPADLGGTSGGPQVGTYPFTRPQLRNGLLIATGIVCLGLVSWLLASWFKSRPVPGTSQQNPPPPPAAQNTVSADAQALAELVLDAIRQNEILSASALLADAQRKGLNFPGMRYQAALLALQQKDRGTAHSMSELAIAANDHVPECLYLGARTHAEDGRYEAAARSFEEATHYSFFEPKYFFYWAECLRRSGHSTLAVPQFERALRRRPAPADAQLISFKMGLAQIEAGISAESAAQFETKLKQNPPSGDALLLAAALEMNRLSYPEAAEYLKRATEALPAPILDVRLRDFAFQSQARQEAIAAVWPENVPPKSDRASQQRSKLLVDPANSSLAEADPAIW